ncbi:MAG: NAD(P)H-hydrate epimerase [Caldilineaceae bacterium]|nr:NAD(P)H-hydrate epimerase [Caldilineaceae bacterium]
MNKRMDAVPTALPLLSTAQMRDMAQLMTAVYQIELLQQIEYAGWNCAAFAKHLLDHDIIDRPIVILAGRGHKGACGLVAARHLINWGAWVQIVLTHPDDTYQGIPAQQVATVQAMGAPLAWAEEGWELPPTDLVIDALIGTGLQQAPHGKARDLIQLANSSRAAILSLDVPSGVDATTGALLTPHIQATATLTLALPKPGLVTAQAACGALYLADIGVPPTLYADLGLTVPLLFAQDTFLPIVVTEESIAVAYA